MWQPSLAFAGVVEHRASRKPRLAARVLCQGLALKGSRTSKRMASALKPKRSRAPRAGMRRERLGAPQGSMGRTLIAAREARFEQVDVETAVKLCREVAGQRKSVRSEIEEVRVCEIALLRDGEVEKIERLRKVRERERRNKLKGRERDRERERARAGR